MLGRYSLFEGDTISIFLLPNSKILVISIFFSRTGWWTRQIRPRHASSARSAPLVAFADTCTRRLQTLKVAPHVCGENKVR